MQTQKVYTQEISQLLQDLLARLPPAENEEADSNQKTGKSETTSAAHAAIDPAVPARFATIKQAAIVRPVFTEAAYRDIRFKAFDRVNSRGEVIKGNGSGEFGCWIEIGGKVLLDLPRFDAWLESHKVRAA